MRFARTCAMAASLACSLPIGCGPKVSSDDVSGSAAGGGSGSESDGDAGSGPDDPGGDNPSSATTANGTTTEGDTTTGSNGDVGPIDNCVIDAGVAWADPGSTFGIGGVLPGGPGGADSACGTPGSEAIFRMNVSQTLRLLGSATVNGSPAALSIREDCDSTVEVAYGCNGELDVMIDEGEYIVVVDQPTEEGGSFDIQITWE